MIISFTEITLISVTSEIMTYLGVQGGGREVQQVVQVLLVARGGGGGRPHHQQAHVAPDAPEELLGPGLALHSLTVDLKKMKIQSPESRE